MFLLKFLSWKVLLLGLETIVQPNIILDSFIKHFGYGIPAIDVTFKEISFPFCIFIEILSSIKMALGLLIEFLLE